MKTIDIWGSIVPHGDEKKLGDFSSLEMKYALDEANGEDLYVRLQTMGGSILEGIAIYNLMRNYEGSITTENMGMSGSIGTVIFLGGDKKVTHYNASFFIHESRGGSAKDLDMYNNMMAEIYANATGKTKEFFLDEMKKETTYNGQTTLDMGFATELKEDLKAVALMDFYENKPTTTEKEPSMAMTKEEKAKLEALESENLALKEEKESLQNELSENSQEKIQAQIDAGILAEKERESGILASALCDKQKPLAEKLVAEGSTIADAVMAINKDFIVNKADYMKVEPQENASAKLDQEAPNASTKPAEESEAVDHKAAWMELKAEGKFAEANVYFKENIKGAK